LKDAKSRWRQVLYLGEQLLEAGGAVLPGPDESSGGGETPAFYIEYTAVIAQRDLIIAAAVKLVGGQASMWLSREKFLFSKTQLLPEEGLSDENLFSVDPPSALMRQAIQTNQVCCGMSVDSGTAVESYASRAASCRAVAAPILANDIETHGFTVLGALLLELRDGQTFNAGDIEIIEGIALQAAIALQSERRMVIERWRVQQLALVQKVSSQIANVRDLDELARRVTRLILETFDYYYVAIFTLEPGQDVLHFRASAGPVRQALDVSPISPGLADIQVLNIHSGEGIIGFVAQTGEEVVAGDVSQDHRYRHLDALPETRSEIALPLKIEDQVMGVLDVQSNLPDDFSETDLLVLRAQAHNIAIAVKGARLYSALNHHAEQLSTISEVGRAITSILDTDELLNTVVNLIHDRFGYPFVHLFTVHPGRRKIFFEAGSGSRSQTLQEQDFSFDLDDPQGIIPWVARNGKTILANDVGDEPLYRPSPIAPGETRSELTVPLIFGGEVLGVLDVQSDWPGIFTEDSRFLIEALGDNVAIAMRNAYLYRSELWRRKVADSLRETAGLLTTDAGLENVLDAILTELERTLPSDVSGIWLLDEGKKEPDPLYLRLAALHRSEIAGQALEIGLGLKEILDLENRDELQGESDRFSSWLTEALAAGHPVIRDFHSPFDPIGEALGFLSGYSAIAAPLQIGEECLGVLTLAHHTPGRYGTESYSMTAAFASYAAVAIENTRLYESAHEQAWVSTVLLQVAEATQSLNDLNELLATVVRVAPTLIGVKACALYMLDEDETFVPAAASGLNQDQQIEFERWRFTPGDIPAFDWMRLNKQPTLLNEETGDPRLSEILYAGLDPETIFEAELLALVPLLAHGEVLGIFLIDFSRGYYENRDLETLFNERLMIIQGIAHQTAIAVENIRLVKAQKEEAYISVALLQVAQVVVSTNNLDEILGSIVRITPILVGVKRSVIYLWDSERAAFHRSQAYGIPRTTQDRSFNRGEFPILDTVREEDRLVVYPISGVELPPPGPPDAWASLDLPDSSMTDEFLASSSNLLLALPLSVKGEVLGVLLVEEPEAVDVDGFGGGSRSRRLREKRLEIITGISQQAALAIQNDRFQLEMIERGRLERELQLARQIQKSFLPDTLPDLPGWQLGVRWRPAREVGGDFYDIFQLPGGKLGLVIADVADKGMPAALFMTLIRTLVRATVPGIDSPAEVLERVNDVMIPDARDGMFATIIYLILDLGTGRIIYANAGHNPPYLVRGSTNDIERLLKGGMALGVLEGNRIEEKEVELYPGDLLILFTDGVTEVFSPTGEMFGDEGLKKIILTGNSRYNRDVSDPESGSAQEMLDKIDNAVKDFIQDLPLPDDLTLLILKKLID
jgi:sigma-B regulation protein RsbU (phosphoserine phosphatase)